MYLPNSNVDIHIWLLKHHNTYANWIVDIQFYAFLTSVKNGCDSSALRSGRRNTGGDPGRPTDSTGGRVCPSAICKYCRKISFFSIPTIESQFSYAKLEESEHTSLSISLVLSPNCKPLQLFP